MLRNVKVSSVIRDFVEHARSQGSSNADKYYLHLTSLANKTAGIEARSTATVLQLNTLVVIENMIAQIIGEGITQAKYYKDIYQSCKGSTEQFKAVALLGMSA